MNYSDGGLYWPTPIVELGIQKGTYRTRDGNRVHISIKSTQDGHTHWEGNIVGIGFNSWTEDGRDCEGYTNWDLIEPWENTMKPSAEEAAIIRLCWYTYGHLLTPISRFPDGALNKNLARCIKEVSSGTVFHQTILRILETYGDQTEPLMHEYLDAEDVEAQSKTYLNGEQS